MVIPNATNKVTFQLRESSLKSSTARLRKLIRINPIRINSRSAISAALTRSNMNLFIAFGITRSRHKNLRRFIATLNVIFDNWYYLSRLVQIKSITVSLELFSKLLVT
jgi:hypothetical protein